MKETHATGRRFRDMLADRLVTLHDAEARCLLTMKPLLLMLTSVETVQFTPSSARNHVAFTSRPNPNAVAWLPPPAASTRRLTPSYPTKRMLSRPSYPLLMPMLLRMGRWTVASRLAVDEKTRSSTLRLAKMSRRDAHTTMSKGLPACRLAQLSLDPQPALATISQPPTLPPCPALTGPSHQSARPTASSSPIHP